MRNRRTLFSEVACAFGVLTLGLLGCMDAARYDQAICVLIDVSGTYADQSGEVVRIVEREVLPAMEPGDTLLVIRIDDESYERENVEALVTLDQRPSRANAQKLALAQKLEAMGRAAPAAHTDIPGAMMLASEYLRELASGSRVMLVFSDMEEDLPPGMSRRLAEDEFEDIWVVAMNVKRLHGDNADPGGFRSRLAGWQRRVLESGGREWRAFNDAARLPEYLKKVRES